MIRSFLCLLKGNLNCLLEAWLSLVMLKCMHISIVNGRSVGVKVFLSSRFSSDFFCVCYWNTNCHVSWNLKCGVFLLAPLVWSLFIFKWLKLQGLHISCNLKERAEGFSFESIITLLIFLAVFNFLIFWNRNKRRLATFRPCVSSDG